jgi:AraC-like DNA-binding protein
MTGGAEILEILLRGIALGALAATGWAFASNRASRASAVAGVLLCVAVIAYVFNSSAQLRDLAGPSRLLPLALSWGGVGAFWLLVRTLFEDRQLSPTEFSPYLGLTVLGFIGWISPDSIRPSVWIAHNIAEVTLAAHALFVIYRSWRGDLVEARRRLRGPFLAGVALLVTVLAAFEIGEDLGISATWYPLAGAVTLAVFCLVGAAVFLQARPELFGSATPVIVERHPDSNAADRAEIARLTAFVRESEAWRKEGLTIGDLANDLNIPEHRLRRLINDQLGYRNFAAFINAHRIEVAKTMLADVAQARQSISSIAFELGFGSLGPFNRAFKEATGVTPSEWRKRSLETLQRPRG